MNRSIFPLFIIFFILNTSSLFAQQGDSIRNEILSRRASDMEIISKGRSLTLEHLLKGDISALKDVKDYLAGEAFNPYKVYLPVEYWLLSFWTEDYTELLHEAKQFSANIDLNNGGYWQMPERFRPSSMLRMISDNDHLTEEAGKKSAESYLPLTVCIDNSELSVEEKEFLKLWLYSLLFTPDKVDDEPEMEEVNSMATGFLETYENSEYADYTRRFIRYRFRPGNWGLGYEFYLGHNALTGGLSHHFRNSIAGGFALDALYKDFDLSLRFNYASTKTNREVINHNINWPVNIKGYLIGADLTLQYPAFQSRDIKFMPFIGIGGMGMGPTDTEIKSHPELGDFKELSALNYLTGLEIKLNTWSKETDLSRYGGTYIGVRYTFYIPNYNRENNLLDGNMHMVTLSFGGFSRPPKRHF